MKVFCKLQTAVSIQGYHYYIHYFFPLVCLTTTVILICPARRNYIRHICMGEGYMRLKVKLSPKFAKQVNRTFQFVKILLKI